MWVHLKGSKIRLKLEGKWPPQIITAQCVYDAFQYHESGCPDLYLELVAQALIERFTKALKENEIEGLYGPIQIAGIDKPIPSPKNDGYVMCVKIERKAKYDPKENLWHLFWQKVFAIFT